MQPYMQYPNGSRIERWLGACVVVVAGLVANAAAFAQTAGHTMDDFLRKDKFESIKISPDGRHFAATVPIEDGGNILTVIDMENMKMTGYFKPVGKIVVADFTWANPDRILMSVARTFGQLDRPQLTGEIYAMNADGKRQALLVGQGGGAPTIGRSTGKGESIVAAFLLDDAPEDPRSVLVSTFPLLGGETPFTKVERIDVMSGRRSVVASAPVQRASFDLDHQGKVRFAAGQGVDNRVLTYYRKTEKSEWQLFNDEGESGRVVAPLGFAPDGSVAYIAVEAARGPTAIHAMNPETLEMTEVMRSEFADPVAPIREIGGRGVIGAWFYEGRAVMRFFDPDHPDAVLLRSLEASFPGMVVAIDSATVDRSKAVVSVSSDRAPTNYFLFDIPGKKVGHLVARRDWIDPERTAAMQPIQLTNRDGMTLHGYLTLPHGVEARNLPMVVNPHGGPIGIADTWGFNSEVQMLAAHGYAVLQINFRGSGNYGRAHRQAGFGQWGDGMIRDITDAARWVVEQGIADPDRMCIYGASYGGYASLMSVASEPDLYRCAIGYVGIYDIPMMFGRGDIQERRSGMTYLNDMFEGVDQEAISPTRLANRIKVPVMLAAGAEDERTPPEHTVAMAKALEAAGVPVTSRVVAREGHGFSIEENQTWFYGSMLEFLDRHIGAGAAKPAAATGEPAASN